MAALPRFSRDPRARLRGERFLEVREGEIAVTPHLDTLRGAEDGILGVVRAEVLAEHHVRRRVEVGGDDPVRLGMHPLAGGVEVERIDAARPGHEGQGDESGGDLPVHSNSRYVRERAVPPSPAAMLRGSALSKTASTQENVRHSSDDCNPLTCCPTSRATTAPSVDRVA